ncbi:MAG TPA: cellulase family glycosylhydrolase, partial [Acidimicrobiales bacterium]|nr:cellulase family glycosylhydrolase [Acidimicrobiales bacterium]
MRRLRLVLPALLLATLIATIPARASSAPRYSTAGRWIVDGEGRRLLLRGLDVMGAEFTPTTTPLPYGPSDFAAMRAMGATVVRLPVAWSWVEPQRGRYDQAALRRAHDIVAWAGQAGLLVVLDMHQWHWSPCFGGNGMPEWATNPCPHTTPSPTSAAIEAVPEDAFWSSQDLQARFAEAWAAVAAAVGAPDNLLGYDLLNEPPLGTIPPVVFENTVLPRFYRAVAARLRQVDAGGLVFVEPALTHALHRFTMAELGIERAVYEPHLYGNSFNDASGHAGDFLGPGQ